MKKGFAVLAAALIVCMLGTTALAQPDDNSEYMAAIGESTLVMQASTFCHMTLDLVNGGQTDMKDIMRIEMAMYESIGWKASQDGPVDLNTLGIDPEVLELAYSDAEVAGPEEWEKIIEAREAVIMRCGWHDGSGLAFDINPYTREIRYMVDFEDQFPGWDMPRPEAYPYICDLVETGEYLMLDAAD